MIDVKSYSANESFDPSGYLRSHRIAVQKPSFSLVFNGDYCAIELVTMSRTASPLNWNKSWRKSYDHGA